MPVGEHQNNSFLGLENLFVGECETVLGAGRLLVAVDFADSADHSRDCGGHVSQGGWNIVDNQSGPAVVDFVVAGKYSSCQTRALWTVIHFLVTWLSM